MTEGLSVPAPVTLPIGDSERWTSPLDKAELSAHVAWCRAPASTTTEKGQRLECLLAWLLSYLPGFRADRANLYSEDGAQEVDLFFWNEQWRDGFPNFGAQIMCECKNWDRPVDSSDVAWFDWKMRLGGITEGVLFAASGITTRRYRREAAVGILTAANADSPARKIHVITLDDVERLSTTHDLRNLIIEKSMGLAARSPFS